MLRNFSNLKVGIRIGIGFGSLIVIAAILGGIAVYSMKIVSSYTGQMSRQFMPEVNMASNLERYSLLTMYNMRGFGLSRNEAYHQAAQKDIAKVDEYLEKAKKLGEQHSELIKLREQIKPAIADFNTYKELTRQTVDVTKSSKEIDSRLDESAGVFMKHCFSFLASQDDAMVKGINSKIPAANLRELYRKIVLINEVIDLGNSTRVSNFKSAARRDVSFLNQGLKNFSVIDQKLEEIQKITRTADNKQHVAKIHKAADQYRQAMQDLQTVNETLAELGKKRDITGEQVLESAKGISETGMARTTELANDAESDLMTSIFIMIVGLIIAAVLGVLLAVFIRRSITKPIYQIAEFSKKFGEGDMTAKIDLDQTDEIGELSASMNQMVGNLSGIFKSIAEGISQLFSSSNELSAIAQRLSTSADQTSGKSNTVATAAEEMSSNMNNVAAAIEQTSTNVELVATAAEEMTATINEIAGNAEKSLEITEKAVVQAQSSSKKVDELNKVVMEIGQVTATINEISEKTDLLALNATIEAARAGEAGKGFAVVASEIKQLAKKTSDSTQHIGQSIKMIQDSTSSTIKEIEQISSVIDQVNEIVSTIAAAVEEQTATTKEIASNVSQAAQGVKEVSENVSQSSTVASEVAGDISEVNQASLEISENSNMVLTSSGSLEQLAQQLKSHTDRFKF